MAMNLEIIFLTRGGGGAKVYIVLRGGLANVYKYLQGGRGGSKSPKSCLRRKWMTPNALTDPVNSMKNNRKRTLLQNNANL